MKKDEVKIIKRGKASLDELHYQYVHNLTPIKLWNYDMSVAASPHVELLRLMIDKGQDWNAIWATRYVEERVMRREKGLKSWTDEHIKNHVNIRWEIYKSLKSRGYKRSLHTKKNGEERPVIVLQEPFWTSRFGLDYDWLHGKEVWDGGGRCAAACVLGWKEIPVAWAEDIAPGTKDKGRFAKKLEAVKGIWDACLPSV